MVAIKSLFLGAAAVVSVMGAAVEQRTDTADPYAGLTCSGCTSLPAVPASCSSNNCYRAFFNVRNGSAGKHCPSEAFSFCCSWNSYDAYTKSLMVTSSALFSLAPWTANCQDVDGTSADVVSKIDAVCGCTLNHKVALDSTNAYFNFVGKPAGDAACR